MKVCDICRDKLAFEGEEIRDKDTAIMLRVRAVKITQGQNPKTGAAADIFNPIAICRDCLSDVVRYGEEIVRA